MRCLADPTDSRATVAPPHPAFGAFRKMSYIWVDGRAFEPIGDSLDLWLVFLRDRGAQEVWLDVSGGTEVCRVIRNDGAETWTTVWNGGIYMLHGAEDSGPPRPHEIDLARTAAQLEQSVDAELQAGAPDVRRVALQRSIAILGSAGDGEELSDVAWPYFVLPDGSATAARRLIAAACATWPDVGGVPDPAAAPDRANGAVEAALVAIAAAVNSSGTAEPVE
ncbi:MAG TPA: hypothetical protein VIM76_11135 [Candidatus Dormibacteraeota bacterium]